MLAARASVARQEPAAADGLPLPPARLRAQVGPLHADPDFFLQKKWGDLNECLTRCIAELTRVTKRTYGAGKTSLTDLEATYVAIGYNLGSVNLAKGLKQGFNDGNKYYGEYVADYMKVAAAA